MMSTIPVLVSAGLYGGWKVSYVIQQQREKCEENTGNETKKRTNNAWNTKKYLAIRNNQILRKRISYMRVSRRRTRLLQYLFTIFVLVHFGSIWHASSSTTGACHSTGKSRTSQHDATSTARRSKCAMRSSLSLPVVRLHTLLALTFFQMIFLNDEKCRFCFLGRQIIFLVPVIFL
jgi:hypothetical protein